MLRRRLAHIRNAIAAAPLAFPPGHYYSPVCDPIKIRKWYRSHCNEEVPLPGIDLHRDDQINRLLYWNEFFPDIQFPETRTPPWRYYYGRGNLTYAMGDAVCLYSFIRELSPKKYVEIGSGFSSACVLDTIDQLQLDLQCTFIDPEPARFQALLKSVETRDFRLLPRMVQDVPLEIFDELDAGDILFIDSSHVLKTASDVEFELFSILPRLKPGVFVHFHDIAYPFEYWPEVAIVRNYSWNEAYGLRAFLMYNNKFKIEFWSDYLLKTSTKHLPDVALKLSGGSGLWLSVTAS
jgi:predicted O-methyltransferase YrrM